MAAYSGWPDAACPLLRGFRSAVVPGRGTLAPRISLHEVAVAFLTAERVGRRNESQAVLAAACSVARQREDVVRRSYDIPVGRFLRAQ